MVVPEIDRVQQTEVFVITLWTVFCTFSDPLDLQNLNFEKMKKILEDIILQMFTINDSHMISLYSNYFTSAKKCRRESCIMDFTSAKMEFASTIFKNCIFPNIQLKGDLHLKTCLTIEIGS